MYELQYEKPPPLVRRRLRYEIPERMGPRGQVWIELDERAVSEAAQQARAAGVAAVAISFLHAYANPAHERRAAEIVQGIVGEETYITCSSDILAEIREYERTSTAVVNAYVGPVVQRYIRSLESSLAAAGVAAPLQIMQSSGGVMSAKAAIRKPAHLVESGPAAGVVACAYLARAAGITNVISLDMGGTTAKAAILEDGEPVKTSEYEVGAGINLSSRLIKGGGYAIRLPFIDLSEIGAGGGSLVAVDEFGMLHVGPESAGADPGPACYGLGGDAPTLTDALVVLGYLNPEHLAGGTVAIDADAAARSLEPAAALLARSSTEAAYGVFQLAVATMTRAVKAVSTYRGRDPRDFVLCGFGGNGPVVAVAIARALQMGRVLVPPAPGVFSAAGLLLSEIEHEFVQTLSVRGDGASADMLQASYRELEAEAERALVAEGVSREEILISRFADIRYAGQAYELTLPVAAGAPDIGLIAADFSAEHRRTYGHASADAPIDIVNVKLTARAAGNGDAPYDPLAGLGPNAGEQTRRAYFGPEHGSLDVPVISRAALLDSPPREGPLIVEEYDSTCVVPPGCRVTLDSLGNIDIALDS
jgi:N-methylhydantoinase A